MLFFQSKPDIPVIDKARLEFRLQQIADCVESRRFFLPILSVDQLVTQEQQRLEPTLEIIAKHLGFDFSGFKIQESLSVVEEKSGGGG